MGVFEKLGDDKTFTLTKYFAESDGTTSEAIIRKIRENCGWELKVAPAPEAIPVPTQEELDLLRIFDPQQFYIK